MKAIRKRAAWVIGFVLFIFCASSYALEKGIYLTQSSLEDTQKLNYLIKRSKQAGITTFVIDINRASAQYKKNIELVQKNGLRYVARVVVFPHGGTAAQIESPSYWQQRYRLVEQAIHLGADAIQLDYIRYSTQGGPSKQKVHDVHRVISWFKQQVSQYNVPLQIDVFGEASFKPSYRIGQDVQVFASSVDAVNPMVYPSHYHPYDYHTDRPYQTVYKSLQAMKKQFDGNPPFRINAYIEATNYKNPGHESYKRDYLYQQIKAAEDSKINGWYVWSANNRYDHLFDLLTHTSI